MSAQESEPPSAASEELCYVPHCGWLAYEPGDAVLTGLREGDFEFAEQAFLHRVLRPGDVMIDCGAHSGLFTKLGVPLVSPGGWVHAIEPAPHSFSRLQRSTADLPSGSCALHLLALGKANGEVSFIASEAGQSAYNHVAGPTETADTIMVQQLTLPEFMRQNNLHKVDFMKIDAEGQEWDILQAAAPLLSQGAVQGMMIEFNQENLARYGASCAALTDLLAEHGYSCFTFALNPFRLVPAHPSDRETYANFIVVRDVPWLQRRFDNASPAARKIADDIVQHGDQVSTQKRRMLESIAEQDAYIQSLRSERDQLSQSVSSLNAQVEGLAVTSRQQDDFIAALKKERDQLSQSVNSLNAQVEGLAATSHQQDGFIATLKKERDQLSQSVTSLNAQVEGLAVTSRQQDGFIATLKKERDQLIQSVSSLTAQVEGLALTSRQQDDFIATLKKEQNRLESLTARLTTDTAHYVKVIDEQTAYIGLLEQQCNQGNPASGA